VKRCILFNRGHGWGRLAFDGPGVDLEPHMTRNFDVHDKVTAAAQRAGQVALECDFGYPGPRHNPSHAQIFGNDTVRFGTEVVRGHKHVPDPPTKCS
jgi:hypothetical protein